MFNTVSIIGIGLIGSSIARALKKHNLCNEIIIYDKNVDNLVKASQLGLGSVTCNINVAKQSDIIIICVPVGAYEEIFNKILPISKNTIVTDVGSVKGSIIKLLEKFPSFEFVPGHPIAGTEFSGPEAGFAELFENRWTILNPSFATQKSIDKIAKMWGTFNSKVEIMDIDHHDSILSLTSHLPHLIAFSVVGTAMNFDLNEISKFSAGGFRDFTRIAASDPTMWKDIFLHNKNTLLETSKKFKEILTMLEQHIENNNAETLIEFFTKTKEIRHNIIEAKQS